METFPRHWTFVRGIHRLPVNSPHKGQWGEALMLSLICTWTNGWVNNRDADNFRRHRAPYDVIVMTNQPHLQNQTSISNLLQVPANHLITASFMAAPCALGLSKLSCPETEESQNAQDVSQAMESTWVIAHTCDYGVIGVNTFTEMNMLFWLNLRLCWMLFNNCLNCFRGHSNVVEAAGAGASESTKLVAGIAANLIAFLSLLDLVNGTLAWFGDRAGLMPPDYPTLSFQVSSGYIHIL